MLNLIPHLCVIYSEAEVAMLTSPASPVTTTKQCLAEEAEQGKKQWYNRV